MASTAPRDFQTALLISEAVDSFELVVHRDDVRRVRLYCRLAAGVAALGVVLLALAVVWLASRLFNWESDSGQTLVVLIMVLLAAAVMYLRAELRLRTYHLELTADAVIFEYGRNRSYVPRKHIQLFDTESSILLRIFSLRRCNLHTGGGTVIVSPVPARVVSTIERLIYEQPTPTRADRDDATS